MSLSINTNIASMTAQNNVSGTQDQLSVAIARLSSGLRINSAKDDAAGLAIASRFTTQVNGLTVAARNANDAISLAQTADGSLGSVSDDLQRLRELAVQSANATNSAQDRASLQAEAAQLIAEVQRVGTTSAFNGVNLLDGSFTSQSFQIGANAGQTITLSNLMDARTSALGSTTLTAAGTITGTVVSAATNGVTAATSGTGFTITTASGGTTSPITYAANAGADAIATAINSAASTIGVTATASNSTTLSTLSSIGNGNGTVTFTINGQAVSAVLTSQNDLSNLVSAINGVAGTSGVTATMTSTSAKNSITLSTTDGRDIILGSFAVNGGSNESVSFGGTTLTEGGTVTADKVGTVQLKSTQGAITTANASAQVFASAGVNNSSFSSLAAADISTAAGASAALGVIDDALNQVNSGRAKLGAYEHRFQTTIADLQSTNLNLSQARSRIQDADFAAETANMSKAQVLQQAGTAMVAQANQLPQQVLQLLKG